MGKRIIIFYITPSSGHYKAAKSLKQAFLCVDKAATVITIDALRFFHPFASGVINALYIFTLKKFPQFWGRIYDRRKVVRSLGFWQKLLHWLDRQKAHNLFLRLKPDVVVCTQAFPCGVVASFKKHYSSQLPLVASVTDFLPHGFWVYDQVTYYTVPTQQGMEYLAERGVPVSRIKVFGIPIMPSFRQKKPKGEIATKYGFQQGLPAVLLMGGGSGFGPLRELVQDLDMLASDFQCIIVCGRNQALHQWFLDHKATFRKPVSVHGYVDSISEFMDFSDIIVTKPGGITISEALAKSMAIVIVNPIPGQEERNMRYLVKHKVALAARNPYQAALIIKSLLLNRDLLEELRRNAGLFSRAESSLDIARLALSLSSQS